MIKSRESLCYFASMFCRVDIPHVLLCIVRTADLSDHITPGANHSNDTLNIRLVWLLRNQGHHL